MPNINLDQNYFEHIKTIRLVARHKKSAALVPIRLWCYASKNPETNGRLIGYTLIELSHLCDWTGNIQSLLSDMVEIGFLEKLDSGKNDYKIHDWETHQGHIIAFSERSKKANKVRWDKYREEKNERKSTGGAGSRPL